MTTNIDIIRNFKFDLIESDNNRLTSIIILTYNKLEYTKLCIESIRKFTKKGSYEIIVVDNNSTDDTVEWLRQQGDLKVIYNDENKGFPGGCNQGIEIASGENILLLNNDAIVTPNWLYNLDKALWSDEKIGAVSCQANTCSYNQSIHVDYNSMEEMLEFANRYNVSNEELWDDRLKLIGFCFMVKKSVIDEVGNLDERFFPGNFEDDDISFRIIEKGYRLILCKDTFLHHYGSVSFKNVDGGFDNLLNINSQKFEEKWKFNSHSSNYIRFDLIQDLPDNKDEEFNILEIGCGTGATLLEIKNNYKNANLYGVDINKNVLNIAKNVTQNVILGDIKDLELPYENGYFDYIIIGDLLQDIPNPEKIIKKIKKYLKNGGYLIFTVINNLNIKYLKQLFKPVTRNNEYITFDEKNINLLTLDKIRSIITNNEYSLEKLNAFTIEPSESEKRFIDSISKLQINNSKDVYTDYRYLVKAKNIDFERYKTEEMVKFKQILRRIDNGYDLKENLDYIVDIYKNNKSTFISDLEHIIEFYVLNKEDVLNKISKEFYVKNNHEIYNKISKYKEKLELKI